MAKRLKSNEAFRDKRVHIGSPGRTGKMSGETRCPECGLIFHDGVWKESATPILTKPAGHLCPACQQIRDGITGGIVEFDGGFVLQHREELLNRIRNLEMHTRKERPMERIINIKEAKNKIVVSATTEHLIAKIGKAILRDFGGSLSLKYAPEEKFATAKWHRD